MISPLKFLGLKKVVFLILKALEIKSKINYILLIRKMVDNGKKEVKNILGAAF